MESIFTQLPEIFITTFWTILKIVAIVMGKVKIKKA